jgi:hypothetical protein
MSRKPRPVASREYKMMLKAKRFEGGEKKVAQAAEKFRKAFAQSIRKFVVLTDGEVLGGEEFKRAKEKKQAIVQFFDTKARLLRASDFVCRRRQPLSGGKAELALKRRHPDRFFVSGSETGGEETKFEEDIKATKNQAFISLHSLSGKEKVDDDVTFQNLADIQRFYAPLKVELGEAYAPDQELERVGNFTAEQAVLEGPEFKLGENVEAKCGLIVWYEKGGSFKKPVVAEFSFRYKAEDLVPDGTPEAEVGEPYPPDIARRCFAILQALRNHRTMTKWVDLKGPTKTSYVYQLQG